MNPELHFVKRSQDEDGTTKWHPVPEWSDFLLRLGRFVGQQDPEKKLRIGLSLPTRAFAAPFISFGIGLERASIPIQHKDGEKQLAVLQTLPNGAAVYFYEGDKKKKGVWEICSDTGHMEYWVRVHSKKKGGLRTLIHARNARGVQPAEIEFWDKDLPGMQKGHPLSRHTSFAQDLLGTKASSYARFSRLENVVIGTTKLLNVECRELIFGVSVTENCYHEGALNDVVRMKTVADDGTPYRTIIFSAGTRAQPEETSSVQFPAVIFDGALSFLKWRDAYRTTNWVTILDRTEPQYEDAVVEFNKECLSVNKSDCEMPVDLTQVPQSIHMTVYRET